MGLNFGVSRSKVKIRNWHFLCIDLNDCELGLVMAIELYMYRYCIEVFEYVQSRSIICILVWLLLLLWTVWPTNQPTNNKQTNKPIRIVILGFDRLGFTLGSRSTLWWITYIIIMLLDCTHEYLPYCTRPQCVQSQSQFSFQYPHFVWREIYM